ncbi:thiol:disulfide interchange protein DsbA/DsbL [Thioalkalivibrio paradoxus]|uniref:Thiol:disulfide interchange protein n=1 Tax=Thioalkalivibrio paradoxus ARh 1 TaxID=713585 RepID=W0DR76_9GAMM|nr:thiol:disulfide interchange protein DsbA/DsbL [Thioalkalivibrio paradoxus]AHE99737.1 DSBA oxidoreductase [Thioalkalivibrio paradoxus ARh 1]
MNRRHFIGTLLGGSALLASGAGLARDYTAGIDYRELFPRVDTGLPDGRIQVVEVFWYGCPHCYQLQPLLRDWKTTLPEHVDLQHLPAAFNDLWALHARVFFAAQTLGVLEEIHQPFFEAIHGQGRNLRSESAILRFVDQRGIDADAFREAMRSPDTGAALQDAGLRVQAYQVEGTPSMVVDGRAMVSSGMSGSHSEMLRVVDHLIGEFSA